MLTGKLVTEVSITSLQSHSVVSSMQLVSHQQHRSQLAVVVNGSELISWVHISDAAATEAVLAGRFAAMNVEQAGKCNEYWLYPCSVALTAGRAEHKHVGLISPTSTKNGAHI